MKITFYLFVMVVGVCVIPLVGWFVLAWIQNLRMNKTRREYFLSEWHDVCEKMLHWKSLHTGSDAEEDCPAYATLFREERRLAREFICARGSPAKVNFSENYGSLWERQSNLDFREY